MRSLGPRGATVLSLAGIAGVFLAVIGWTQRGTGLVASAVTAPPSAAASASGPASVPASPAAPASGGPPSAPAAAAAAGPALSAEPYASYAYLVWPGARGGAGKLAMTGFTLEVTRRAGGISVTAVQDGQAMTSASHFYPGGAKVYLLDSNLGDDGGGNVDYDQTDDGLIVTNAQGQVLP